MSILKRTIQGIFGSSKRVVHVPNELTLPPVEDIRQTEGGSVIAFIAGSEGGALENLTKEALQPFQKLVTNVFIIDLNSAEWLAELNNALKEPVWFVYSFFGVGQDLQVDSNFGRRNYWELARIPFVRVFGDIPAYFPEKHVAKYLNSINLYGDKSFSDFYQRWFENQALSLYPPPFPISQRPLEEVDRDLKLRGRIIFPKNGNSPDNLVSYWRTSLPTTVTKILEAVAEECVSDQRIDSALQIDDMVIRHYKDIGIGLGADRALICFLVAQVDDYVRRHKSTLVVRSVLDLPVLVCGKGWEHVNFHGRRAVLEDNSSYESTSAQIDGALALLDMSPNIVMAPHDRVVRAIGRGTAFLTNRQQFMELFIGSSRNCTYSFTEESIHNLVEHYIQHPLDAVELGIEQSKIFREAYPPSNHADAVIAAVQLMSLRLSGRPSGTQNFVDFSPKQMM